MRHAKAKVPVGLRAIRKGELDVAEEVASELEELAATADLYPDTSPERWRNLQLAAHLITQAEKEHLASQPFGEVRKSRTFLGADGNWRTTEWDLTGRSRTTVHDAAEAEQQATANKRPWDNGGVGKVTLEDFGAWDQPTRRAFMAEYPHEAERLKQLSSVELMTRAIR